VTSYSPKSISPAGVIGSLIIVGSVFLPYFDLGFLGSATGLEMLQLYGEVAGEVGGPSGSGGGGGEGMGVLGWAIFLFAISPIVNLILGGLSLIMSLLKVGLRGAGILHIIFSGALLLTTVASTTDALFVEVSVMDVWGIGIWVAMVGGLVLLFDSNSGS
jgi:hypothetical protein